MKIIKLFLSLYILVSAAKVAAVDYYVSISGSDENTGEMSQPFLSIQHAMNQVQPGDTVHVRAGTYRNEGFGEGDDNNSVVQLNNAHSGTENAWVTLQNYGNEKAIIEFDGSGGIIGGNVSYLRIKGFEIIGPNQSIDLETARDVNVRCLDSRIKKYQGRGIAFWPSGGVNHHIEILNNVVHDAPASGIRVNGGDYITIEGNEIYNTTWYTSAAESALTIADARSIDTNNGDKIIVRRNYVHHNYNRVAFYKGNSSGPGNTNPTYGDCSSHEIVDGQGIYITQSTGYDYGWTVFENNVAAFNGMNGITFHKSNRGKVINNTVYKNGITKVLDPVDGNISWSGITVNNAATAIVENNIIWGRGNNCLRRVCDTPGCSNITYSNNLYYNCNASTLQGNGSIWEKDPLFVGGVVAENALVSDYAITDSSPAIAAGLELNASTDDFINDNVRPGTDGLVSIGAFEKDFNTQEPVIPSVFRIENKGLANWLKSVTDDAVLVTNTQTGDYTRWTQVDAGNGFFYIENVATGKRLKGQATTIPLVASSNSGDYVKWSFVYAGDGDFYLVNKHHSENNTGTPNLWGDSRDDTMLSDKVGSWSKWIFVDAN
jgi:parallel beta-helix repeat protein